MKEDEIIEVFLNSNIIKEKIYIIRGKKVMFDKE